MSAKPEPDMRRKAFREACAKYGFVQEYLWIYRLPNGVAVNIQRVGSRRRDQLKYMIKENRKNEIN